MAVNFWDEIKIFLRTLSYLKKKDSSRRDVRDALAVPDMNNNSTAVQSSTLPWSGVQCSVF